eukprot:5797834-Pleurochrysis_carterae.AAC.3
MLEVCKAVGRECTNRPSNQLRGCESRHRQSSIECLGHRRRRCHGRRRLQFPASIAIGRVPSHVRRHLVGYREVLRSTLLPLLVLETQSSERLAVARARLISRAQQRQIGRRCGYGGERCVEIRSDEAELRLEIGNVRVKIGELRRQTPRRDQRLPRTNAHPRISERVASGTSAEGDGCRVGQSVIETIRASGWKSATTQGTRRAQTRREDDACEALEQVARTENGWWRGSRKGSGGGRAGMGATALERGSF